MQWLSTSNNSFFLEKHECINCSKCEESQVLVYQSLVLLCYGLQANKKVLRFHVEWFEERSCKIHNTLGEHLITSDFPGLLDQTHLYNG